MSVNHPKIIIIGGGLSGLTAAYLLKKEGVSSLIIEARDRLGGRILTTDKEGEAPLEMGATWLGKKHINLTNLLEELDLGIYEQILGEQAVYEPISTSPHQIVQLPPNTDPSFRIQGGTTSLINKLASFLDDDQIALGQVVRSIRQENDQFLVSTATAQFPADIVISTLPPRLLVQNIEISPALPQPLVDTAKETHTWMGESIKIGLTYSTPFWREGNNSGTIVSNVGPIPEMYDHSNVEDSYYALVGFLNGAYFSTSKEQRLTLILRQLSKYYGEEAKKYISYEEAVWRKEPYTFTEYNSAILPHQNNGHTLFRQEYLNSKFFIAGSETAHSFPGYMDGAVQSAYHVSRQILQMQSS